MRALLIGVFIVACLTTSTTSQSVATCLQDVLNLETSLGNALENFFTNQDEEYVIDIIQSTVDLAELVTCSNVFLKYLTPFTNVNATACAAALLQVQMNEMMITGEWTDYISVNSPTIFFDWAQQIYLDIEAKLQILPATIVACTDETSSDKEQY